MKLNFLKKGMTLSETLISVGIATVIMIGSTELILRVGKLNNKVSSIYEQRNYITNIRKNIFDEISKAKFFYFSHLQGIPQDVLNELPDDTIENTSITEAKDSYNLSSIENFSLSSPNYSSVVIGGNLNTESSNSNSIGGEILHFAEVEVVDLLKLFNQYPSPSDSNPNFKLDYGLENIDSSGNGKIMIRMITDCYIYPRKMKEDPNFHEIVVRKSRYAFQVVADLRSSIKKYRPDIIMNTSIIDKNPTFRTDLQKELAWKSLYEKITYRLMEKGFIPWAELNSNSTYVDQSSLILPYLSLGAFSTVGSSYTPFYYKKVIAKYISPSSMRRNVVAGVTETEQEISRNGVYFSILKNVPDQTDLPSGVSKEEFAPGQKSHFITGVSVKIDLKKPIYEKDGIKYLEKKVDFTVETKNNRVYY